MKLLIAVPCHDYLDVEFIRSLEALARRLHKDNVDFEIRFEAGTLVYLARDTLSDYASKNCFTHVLWLDSDMVFSDDVLEQLMETRAEIATGVCRSRHGKYNICLYKNQHEMFTEIPDKIFEVFACGFACVLTTTMCLEHVSEKNNGHPFEPTKYFGEDLQFCIRAGGMGYRIMCNPEAKVGHVGRITIWPDSVEELRSYNSKKEGK